MVLNVAMASAKASPREVALLEEFLNTLDLERFGDKASKPDEERDAIHTPATLKRWLVERNLLQSRARVTNGDVKTATELRNGFRAMLRAAQGLPFDEGALRRARRLSRRSPLSVDLGHDGVPRLRSSNDNVAGALGYLLSDAAMAAATGALLRLKVCSADDCQFVFYDRSRSRTQRWCAMETCGNRVKTRRYRHRHRS
jgi:predicted RNA-binding Zn ribbon-like protein